jgi:hypothetical protein
MSPTEEETNNVENLARLFQELSIQEAREFLEVIEADSTSQNDWRLNPPWGTAYPPGDWYPPWFPNPPTQPAPPRWPPILPPTWPNPEPEDPIRVFQGSSPASQFSGQPAISVTARSRLDLRESENDSTPVDIDVTVNSSDDLEELELMSDSSIDVGSVAAGIVERLTGVDIRTGSGGGGGGDTHIHINACNVTINQY